MSKFRGSVYNRQTCYHAGSYLLKDRSFIVIPLPFSLEAPSLHLACSSTYQLSHTEAHPHIWCHSVCDSDSVVLLNLWRSPLQYGRNWLSKATQLWHSSFCVQQQTPEAPPPKPKSGNWRSHTGKGHCDHGQEDIVSQTESFKATCITYLRAKQVAGGQHPSHQSTCVQANVLTTLWVTGGSPITPSPHCPHHVSHMSQHLMIILISGRVFEWRPSWCIFLNSWSTKQIRGNPISWRKKLLKEAEVLLPDDQPLWPCWSPLDKPLQAVATMCSYSMVG